MLAKLPHFPRDGSVTMYALLKMRRKKKQLWTVLKIKNLLLKNLFCNFMVCVLFIQCTMAVFSNGRFAWYAVLSSRASAAALCGTLNITLEWEMGTLEKVGWKKGNQKSSKCDWGGSTEGIWLHVLEEQYLSLHPLRLSYIPFIPCFVVYIIQTCQYLKYCISVYSVFGRLLIGIVTDNYSLVLVAPAFHAEIFPVYSAVKCFAVPWNRQK